MKNAIKSNITEKRGFTSEMLCLSVDSDRSNNSSQSGLVWIDVCPTFTQTHMYVLRYIDWKIYIYEKSFFNNLLRIIFKIKINLKKSIFVKKKSNRYGNSFEISAIAQISISNRIQQKKMRVKIEKGVFVEKRRRRSLSVKYRWLLWNFQ